tara:strand:+ start:506 stop:916 length:411 start_codon:yes stop_codon:yes gene_type:complete
MGAPKNLQCPRCGESGYGTREKKVKKYRYTYFGHRVKKDSRWSIRWCYLGKPDLGNKLGNINQAQHSFGEDFCSTIPEMSVKPDFDRNFESSGMKRKNLRALLKAYIYLIKNTSSTTCLAGIPPSESENNKVSAPS